MTKRNKVQSCTGLLLPTVLAFSYRQHMTQLRRLLFGPFGPLQFMASLIQPSDHRVFAMYDRV